MGSESAVFFLIFAAVFILFFFAVAGAALFFRRFNENTKYIESNIRRVRDKGEYSYWVRELQCHYLCLIPFVGRRNVSRVYRFIFRKPNRDKNKEYCRGIYRILAPSIVGIGICTVCLCGASWAWFNASVGSTMQTIKTPTYQFESIVVKSKDSSLTANNGVYTLAAGTEYTVEIKTTGTAGATGYCTLVINGNESAKRHTAQISAGDTFSFKILANEDASIKLTGNWGTSSNEGERIANGAEISIGEPKNSNETKTENNAKPAAPVISESKTEAAAGNKSESREENSDAGKTESVTEKASQSQSSGETSSSAGTESDKIPE